MNPFDAATPSPEELGAKIPKKQADIVVMPEKYYGVALKMDAREIEDTNKSLAMPTPPPPPKPKVVVVSASPEPHRALWPMIAIVLLALLGIVGGFVYYNRKALFGKPQVIVTNPTSTQQVVQAPAAPTGLTAQAPTGTFAVQLSWQDVANNETGYKLERAGSDGNFFSLTTLPANSTSFLDVSVLPGSSYSYKITAQNTGGSSAPITSSLIAISQKEAQAPSLPPGGLDSDSDGLTDQEEVVFSTDAKNPDTDSDGFLDGNEVFHFYNPAAKAPLKLVETTLVKEFKGSIGWSMQVPTVWTQQLTIADGQKAQLATGQGETFLVEVLPNQQALSAKNWYLSQHATSTAEQLREVTTKMGLQGVLSPDRLQAVFQWASSTLVLTYQPGAKPFINYRTIYEMMINSLVLQGVPVIITPPQDSILEGPGDVIGTNTTTSLIPTPVTATTTATTSQSTTTQP